MDEERAGLVEMGDRRSEMGVLEEEVALLRWSYGGFVSSFWTREEMGDGFTPASLKKLRIKGSEWELGVGGEEGDEVGLGMLVLEEHGSYERNEREWVGRRVGGRVDRGRWTVEDGA